MCFCLFLFESFVFYLRIKINNKMAMQNEKLMLTATDLFTAMKTEIQQARDEHAASLNDFGIKTEMQEEWGAKSVTAFLNRPWTKASAAAFSELIKEQIAIETQIWPEEKKPKSDDAVEDSGENRILKRKTGFFIQLKASRGNAAQKWFEEASREEQQKWSNAGEWAHVSETEKDRLAWYMYDRFFFRTSSAGRMVPEDDGLQFPSGLNPADASIRKRHWEKLLKQYGAGVTSDLNTEFGWWRDLAPMYLSENLSEINVQHATSAVELQQAAENQNVQTPPPVPPPPFAAFATGPTGPATGPAYLDFSGLGRFEQSFVRPVVPAPPGLLFTTPPGLELHYQ